MGPHLSFHAERSGYILFTGFKCKLGSWTGVDCHDEVNITHGLPFFFCMHGLTEKKISFLDSLYTQQF